MLTPKLGEGEAKELVYFVEESRGDIATKADLEKQFQIIKADHQNFATKDDLQILKKVDLQILKSDLEKQIQTVKVDLEKQIQTVKVDLIKWAFGFWITLLIAIILKGFI